MPKFNISFAVEATGFWTGYADSEEEAREIAREEFSPDFRNTELGDTQEIVDVEEVRGL